VNALRIVAAFAILLAASLLGVTAARAATDLIDLRRIDAVAGDAAAGKAKAAACMGCHGPAGIAPVPMFPNLAGQKIEYLYWALVEFQRAARADSPMTAQVAKLDDVDLRDLAAYFAAQPAAVAGADAATPDARAAALFHHGDPARGIPPCQGCHGIEAGGHPLAADAARYRTYPMLRGQHAPYLTQRLKDYRDGKLTESGNDRIMRGVARSLDDDSIDLLSSWLQAGAR
ncbi:MAG TPA: c-type cytochrome, partial [Dokdonella sp.]